MKNEHTFCPDKCSSCYIVVNVLVSAGVCLLFQLEDWLSKVSASNFIWIWIWCFEFTILIQIQSSNLQRYAVIPNSLRCYLFGLSVHFSCRKIMTLRVSMTVKLSFHTINQSSARRDTLWRLWINLIFNCILHLMICMLGSVLNP